MLILIKNFKRHLEFSKLVEIMEIQDNKLLKHVKRCILGIRTQLKTRTQSFLKIIKELLNHDFKNYFIFMTSKVVTLYYYVKVHLNFFP
jgi:hypothetical protein